MKKKTNPFFPEQDGILLSPLCIPVAANGAARAPLILTAKELLLVKSIKPGAAPSFFLVNAPKKSWIYALFETTKTPPDNIPETEHHRLEIGFEAAMPRSLLLCGGIVALIAPSLDQPLDPSFAIHRRLCWSDPASGRTLCRPTILALDGFLRTGITAHPAQDGSVAHYFRFGPHLAAHFRPSPSGDVMLFSPTPH